MDSQDITVTQSRFNKTMTNAVNSTIIKSVPPLITEALADVKVFSCVMTKFYPYLDKAEVQFNDGSLKLCKILHRFGGDLVDFYTPVGEDSFCETLKEPCILPICELNCLVVNMEDGSDEYLLIGYYIDEDIVGYDPADKGNLKLMSVGASTEYWLKFNSNGVDIRSKSEPTTSVGDLEEEMVTVEYPSKSEVDSLIQEAVENINPGSQDDVYTKAEVDELINAVYAHVTNVIGDLDDYIER